LICNFFYKKKLILGFVCEFGVEGKRKAKEKRKKQLKEVEKFGRERV
jgi:hypothetical protein